MENNLNLIQLVRTILKWKTMILGAVIISGIVSIIVALYVMPEYYKSGAVFYPINQGITDRANLFGSEKGDNRVEYYGTKQDANRILEVANSAPIIDFMINHFNLAQHYGMDTATEKFWRYKVKKKFLKNYIAMKTERDALKVEIEDTDPKLAAEMVDLLLEKIDEHNKRPILNSKFKIRDLFEGKVKEKREELMSLTDSLGRLGRQYKIKLTVSPEGGDIITGSDVYGVERYRILHQQHKSALEEFTELSTTFEQHDLSTKENVSSLYVIEKPYPADRKSRPIRWLVCVSTVMITGFLAIVAALLIEQFNWIREQL